MNFKIIIHKPEYFSSKSSEGIESFIENFKVIAIVNGWEDTKKLIILPLYLTDLAESFVQVLKIRNENLTWDLLKLQLIEKFTVIGNKNLLSAQIIKRKVKEEETLKEYIINRTQLCYKVDRNMTVGKICEKVLKCLPDEVYDKIGLLDNNIIDKINTNVERYEVVNY